MGHQRSAKSKSPQIVNGFQSVDARNHGGFKSKAEDVTELPDSGSQMRSEGRGASNKIVPT